MAEVQTKTANQLKKHKNYRRIFVLVFFYVLAGSLLVRAFSLQIIEQDFLLNEVNNRIMRSINIPAVRGMILDRNGEPLAVSTEVYSVWGDPLVLNEYSDYFKSLASALNMETKHVAELMSKRENSRFVWLKRRIPPHEADAVIRLNLPGIYIEKEYKRFYPDAEITSQLLGFTDADDDGIEGIELEHNDSLKGVPGSKQVIRDTKNRIIEEHRVVRNAEPGETLVLTIDRRIQLSTYRALKSAMVRHQAKSGAAIVVDAWNGEVLAMVSQPAGNPNNLRHRIPELMKNRTISDVFEPGSTIKPFVVALGLESRKWTPNSVIETGPAYIVSGNRIVDVSKTSSMNVTTVLVKSSNIGVAKIALSLPASALWKLYQNLGIGQKGSLSISGEQVGRLGDVKRWERSQFEHATKSFGYGISLNVSKLAQMYSVFANQGKLEPLKIIKSGLSPQKKNGNYESKQIFSPDVTETMVSLLEKVVTEAASSKAKVKNYRVGGKSGTVRKLERGKYSKDKHRAFFAGIAPITNPRYVVVVMIDEPTKDGYYGGAVAAPVFSEIMGNTLRIMNVKPDRLTDLPKLQLLTH